VQGRAPVVVVRVHVRVPAHLEVVDHAGVTVLRRHVDGAVPAAVHLVVAQQAEIESKIESDLSYCSFKRSVPGRFERGFDRVNLHHPTWSRRAPERSSSSPQGRLPRTRG